MPIQNKSKIRAFSSIRSVFSLSLGTLIVQSLSAVGQFILAIWLTPSEFGYWAAAVSAMTTLTALTNFGEVNGYLSGANNSLKIARLGAFKLNLLLTILGMGISTAYFFLGNNSVAVYCLVIALTIPLNGDADLGVAAGIQLKRFSNIVLAQAVGAVLKFSVSVLIAYTLKSAIALALSTTLYYVVVIFALRSIVKKAIIQERDLSVVQISKMKRAEWALNSYFMTFPVQAIFLSAQFFLSSNDLGLLYIGFQITLALSGLLSVPLNRIVLSTLSKISKDQRGNFVSLLSCAIAFIVTFVSASLALGLTVFGGLLPAEWVPAVPLAIAFLVAMPMRILSPIIEARQQVEKKWVQATLFNVVESLGSMLLILICSRNTDLIVVALAVSAWKIVLGGGRSLFVLRGEKFMISVLPFVTSLIGGALLLVGLFRPFMGNLVTISILAICAAIFLLFLFLNKRRIKVVGQ